MLIVLEGLDASGKTTQTDLLVQHLRADGLTVYTLDFPQYENNVFGKILKRFLANDFGDSVTVDPKLSALLFAGDRYESKETILEWLKEPNAVVVLNRYVGSNEAYNRAKAQTEEESYELKHFINGLEYSTFGLPRPDQVIVIGSSSTVTHKRLKTNEQDGYESNATYLDKVAQVYKELCDARDDWEYIPIDGTESRETVHEMIWEVIQNMRKVSVLDNYLACRDCGEKPTYFGPCKCTRLT